MVAGEGFTFLSAGATKSRAPTGKEPGLSGSSVIQNNLSHDKEAQQ